MLHDGLYEQVINKGLDTELSVTDKLSQTASVDGAEVSKVLAKYVAEVVEKGQENLKVNGGDLHMQVALADRIITTVISGTKEADFWRSRLQSVRSSFLRFLIKNSAHALDEWAAIIRPVNITWKLDHPIPAKYLKKTNKLVAG